MGSAIGVLLLSSGVFLIWAGITDSDPIAEIQAAFGAKPRGAGSAQFGEGGSGSQQFGEGGSGSRQFN